MGNTYDDDSLFWSSQVFLIAVSLSYVSMLIFEPDLGATISSFLIIGAVFFIVFALIIIPFVSWLLSFIEKYQDKS